MTGETPARLERIGQMSKEKQVSKTGAGPGRLLEDGRPLTTGEIAAYCQVTLRAVLKWVSSGKLKAYRTPGRHCRVRQADFVDFLRRYNMPVPADLSSVSQPPKRVLIVDDDQTMTRTLQHMLNTAGGYLVDVAYDGFSAGFKFAVDRPDLLTLDLRMPVMDGIKVLSMLRADPRNKGVKILIITAVSDMEEIEEVLKLGADDFLIKPIKHEEFLEKAAALTGLAG